MARNPRAVGTSRASTTMRPNQVARSIWLPAPTPPTVQVLNGLSPQALLCAQAFMARVAKIDVLACPRCKAPLHVVQTLPGSKYLPSPGAHPLHLLQYQPVGARAPP